MPSDISSFSMVTHPWEMVNHPEEDFIRIYPPNQDVHIYCGLGLGPFVPCLVFGTGVGFKL